MTASVELRLESVLFDVHVSVDGVKELVRPRLMVLQDITTCKLVAWVLSAQNELESARELIEAYSRACEAPAKIHISHSQTDGLADLLASLDIEAVWESPYVGKSKPIERALRDLCEDIEDDLFCVDVLSCDNFIRLSNGLVEKINARLSDRER